MKFIQEYKVFEAKKLKKFDCKYVGDLKDGWQKINPSDYDKYKYVYLIGDGGELRRCACILANDNRIKLSKTYDEDEDENLKIKEGIRQRFIDLGYEPDKFFVNNINDGFLMVCSLLGFIIQDPKEISWAPGYTTHYFALEGKEGETLAKSKFFMKNIKIIMSAIFEYYNDRKKMFPTFTDEKLEPAYFKYDDFWREEIKKNPSLIKDIYEYISPKLKNEFKHLGMEFGFFD